MNAQPRFDGETYDEARDGQRLATQLERVRALMADGNLRSLAQIAQRVKATEASVSARLRDLRKAQHGGHTVERVHAGSGCWLYRVAPRNGA